jgi:hypothetical protein
MSRAEIPDVQDEDNEDNEESANVHYMPLFYPYPSFVLITKPLAVPSASALQHCRSHF